MNNNPNNFDKTIKIQYINKNNSVSLNKYKDFNRIPPAPFNYSYEYNPKMIDKIPNVEIMYNHSINIARKYCKIGLKPSNNNIDRLYSNSNEVCIMTCVDSNFNGKNHDSKNINYDPELFIRTNYSSLIKTNTRVFHNRKEHSVLYSKDVMNIRNTKYNLINYNELYKFDVITYFVPNNYERLKGSEFNELDSNSLQKFLHSIESVFQAAKSGGNKILIIPYIDCNIFDICLDDQILAYNMCIVKYGHKFEKIILSLPSYCDIGIYKYLIPRILIPERLLKNIDDVYLQKFMEQKLVNEQNFYQNKEKLKLKKEAKIKKERSNKYKINKQINNNKTKTKSKSKSKSK